MTVNNNQKAPSAAARLANLPVVRSACARLSVLYTGTKSRHPGLKSACEVLESSVTAVGRAACYRASPVIVKLEPQISYANDVACKSLDWLEASFSVIVSSTEQIVIPAKTKMNEIQAGMSIAANQTIDWVMRRMNDGINRSPLKTVVGVTTVGLDTALSLSEALVDQMLPPTQEGGNEEFTWAFSSGSELADQLAECPTAASVPAESGVLWVFLRHSDVQLKLLANPEEAI
ncbi:perilipin-2-like isoform X2 [Simochromis diagramma]|uniref:perilipin-2-like isoform X2 n=1 Tax=Simochromis diagramma TaxID=43689 RepID=UPI001A7E92D7|nr:perilipin-2-like isoform X2 [Simochromis diagramma]